MKKRELTAGGKLVRSYRHLLVEHLAGGGRLPMETDPLQNLLLFSEMLSELCRGPAAVSRARVWLAEAIAAEALRLDGDRRRRLRRALAPSRN